MEKKIQGIFQSLSSSQRIVKNTFKKILCLLYSLSEWVNFLPIGFFKRKCLRGSPHSFFPPLFFIIEPSSLKFGRRMQNKKNKHFVPAKFLIFGSDVLEHQYRTFLGIGIGLKEPILFFKIHQNKQNKANIYHFSCFCREAKS